MAQPKQARSEQTLHRLLDAAEALIQEKGLADASIPEIVRRADSSVGGFYARFRDKNELLRALEERFFRQISALLETLVQPERWGDAPFEKIAEAFIAVLVDVARERQPLIAAFLFRASQDPEFREDAVRFRRLVSKRVSEFALTRRHEIRHTDPGFAVEFAVQLAFGLMSQRVVLGDLRAGGRDIGDGRLVEELTRCILAYLGSLAGVPVESSKPIRNERSQGDPR